MIYEIEGKSYAGMFGNTDYFAFTDVNLPLNNNYHISFDFIITGRMQKIAGETIIILLNDFEVFRIVDY